MIRLLRKRFILMVAISLLAVLSIIIFSINCFNYVTYVGSADELLEIIVENKGEIPQNKNKPKEKKENSPEQKNDKKGDKKNSDTETVYETSFFSVLYNTSGKMVSVDLDYAPYMDKDVAVTFADEVKAMGNDFGHYRYYRYCVSQNEKGTAVVFLDRQEDILKVQQFFIISVVISAIGYLVVFIVICFISKRVIKPFAENQIKQKQFIADAGHEIKTPVTIIKADAEVLLMENGENEWLEDIIRQTERLGRLTDDLVFLSKTDDAPVLALSDVDVSALAKETAEEFKALAKAKDITFDAEIEEGIVFKGEKRSVKRLLTVLLDNAVKYSPSKDGIVASLKQQSKNIVIEIENTAPDMDKNELGLIFDRFYRGDKSRGGDIKGYGLGLSMAKAITDAHKGKISASLNKQRFKITVVLPN